MQVYCDMETDGGGWTVFQRRQDGSVEFLRNWAEYERGFGNLTGEHWLGLKNIHRLTPKGSNYLRVDLGDFAGSKAYAKYNSFEILDSYTQYTIVIGSYSGTAGDSLTYSKMMKFSTKDKDNDKDKGTCSTRYSGAWWFKSCFAAHLNGPYRHGGGTTFAGEGIIWSTFKTDRYSLKFTEMKVRRHN